MRRFFPLCLVMIASLLTVTACGNKPLQLELPEKTPTTENVSTPAN